MIVVDASVVVVALTNDVDEGHRIRRRLVDHVLVAPELLDLEVGSAIRRFEASGHLTPQRATQAFDDLCDLAVDRVPHAPLLARCWELRHNVTMYDAAYVAVAERLGVTLVTADARLANAPGKRCDIELVS